MSVGEICNREVVICLPDDSIREVASLMRDHHVGDVVVVEQGERGPIPVGILTDRDIVIEILAEEVEPDSVNCRDVMSRELATVEEEEDFLTAVELMRDKGIRRIPVINRQGALEGILAVDDLVELITEQLSDLARLFARELRRERAWR